MYVVAETNKGRMKITTAIFFRKFKEAVEHGVSLCKQSTNYQLKANYVGCWNVVVGRVGAFDAVPKWWEALMKHNPDKKGK